MCLGFGIVLCASGKTQACVCCESQCQGSRLLPLCCCLPLRYFYQQRYWLVRSYAPAWVTLPCLEGYKGNVSNTSVCSLQTCLHLMISMTLPCINSCARVVTPMHGTDLQISCLQLWLIEPP